jgi:hypothetical protein
MGAQMIVCSCTVIRDQDIEAALIEVLSLPNAPIPTPGIIFRQLKKRMNCCGCAPLAVETIYNKVGELERKGIVPATVCATARSKLLEFSTWRIRLRGMKPPAPAVAEASQSEPLAVA